MGIIGGIVPGWKVFWNLVGITAFIILAIFVYKTFIAAPPDINDAEENCLAQIKPTISEDAKTFAQKYNLRGAIVARLANDTPNERFKYEVRDALAEAEGVVLVKAPITEQLKSAITGAKSDNGFSNIAAAQKYVKETVGVDFVVLGAVKSTRKDDNAEITLSLTFQGAKPEISFSREYYAASWMKELNEGPGFFAIVGNFLWKLILFFALAFSLPIITYPLNAAIVRLDSNALNAFLLVLYTLLAGLIVLLLAEFAFTGWSITITVLAMVASAFWNYRVLSVTADNARR